jgi:hypothetical protein
LDGRGGFRENGRPELGGQHSGSMTGGEEVCR